MIRETLKNKLKNIGYTDEFIDKHLNEVNFNLLSIKKEVKEEEINLRQYNVPSVEIERAFLNVDGNYLQTVLFDGDVEIKTIQIPTGSRLTLVDFALDQKLCIVLINSEMNLEIVFYNPDDNTKFKYNGQKYENVYGKDREQIITEYLEALTANNRLMLNKAREVVNILTNDFVIDEMILNNINPVLKLYDNPENFAEQITNYQLKYINRKLNKIEVAEKTAMIKRVSKSVKVGLLTNDPYAKQNEINDYTNFKLDTVSYFWLFMNERGKEEIGIYTAVKSDSRFYSETINLEEFDRVARDIANQFTNKLGFPVNDDAIKDVLKKLNHQLVVPPTDTILKYAENPEDPIEPLAYKYKVIIDPAEFEMRLYNSIEDNIGRRYKYKLAENVLEDLTTIGNKLDYTDENGKIIKKQSIADFNENGNAVILRRETLIDASSIPALLGYIYDDVESLGTENLPVPSIEVDFYLPNPISANDGVKMYNGTNYESISNVILTGNKFYEIDNIQNAMYNEKNVLEGSTKVTVRYIAKNGNVLKENVITNVFPGENYVPEILPIISDKEGKEWTCKITRLPTIILSSNSDANKIELEYTEKMADVKLCFINKENQKLDNDKTIKLQVGTELTKSEYSTVVDKDGVEWDIVYSKPEKLTVSEDTANNQITFVYDVTRVDVAINYLNKNRNELRKSITVSAIANKRFSAKIDPVIQDEEGKTWIYISDAAASIVPLENEKNVIDLIYDEMKAKVTMFFESEDGEKVKDDVVEIIQVGKIFNADYDEKVKDSDGKLWKFNKISKPFIKVEQDATDNEITVKYVPVYSKVTIKIINEKGNSIKEDIVQEIQVGTLYESKQIEKICDKKGKIWICKEAKSINVSENEKENIISLVYTPLMVNVTTRYFDVENKEIILPNVIMCQAGDEYKIEIPSKVEDKEGRKWIASSNNLKTYVVKEFEEENKISVYYDKELASVMLSFKDIYGNTILDNIEIKWQIGDKFTAETYEKIKDKSNARWSRVSSEPKNMIVREKNNKFLLIYDEIRTKVVIKYMNIIDNTIIKEADIITAKLGVQYIPTIHPELIDNTRLYWKYAGEKDLSIITNEDEQDNIIVLKYEPQNAKVVVQYVDENNRKILKDNVKEMQIGREVQIKRLENIYSDDKLGWKLYKTTNDIIKVCEEENKNVVTCLYTPWMEDATVEYKTQDGKEIINPITKKVQVGGKFKAEIIDEVTDSNGKRWIYNGDTNDEMLVGEQGITLELKYNPVLKNVHVKNVQEDGKTIISDLTEKIQLGEKYVPKIREEIIDESGKLWKYLSISKKEVVVQDDETVNEVVIKYEKKLVDIVISFLNQESMYVKFDEKLREQIGDVLTYIPEATVVDKNGLGWLAFEKEYEFQIKSENNYFTVQYGPHFVNVYNRYVNDNNEEIIETMPIQRQVGTRYEADVKDLVVDEEGKEWVHVASRFASNSYFIKVASDENKNNVYVKYTPNLTDVTVMYVDPLGQLLKKNTIVKAQVGSDFSAEVIDRITDVKGNKWTYNPNSKNLIKVKKEENTITLSYEEQKALVTYKYQDEYGNRLKAPKKVLVQIGTMYKPDLETVVEDEQGRVWEYKTRNQEFIEIKDAEQDNIFELIYIPLKIDVTLYIKDKLGKEIVKPIIKKAQLGSKYKPSIDATITDENSLMYKFNKIEPEELVVREAPIGSTELINVFTITYEEVYSTVNVKYQDFDGNILREDEPVQLQVGTKYSPKLLQYIKDKRGNQWELVTNEATTIRVMENSKENVIKFVYEVAKADVVIRYKNIDGTNLKEDEHFNVQIGTEFVPETPKYLYDDENKKWSFFNVEPVKLKVGSIDNIITILYQEEKTNVVIRFKDENDKKLKADDRILVQIGDVFRPKITAKVIYDENEIWRFSHFEPKEIIVSENTSENVISQIYTNQEKEISEQEVPAQEIAQISPKEEKIEQVSQNEKEDIQVQIEKELEENEMGYVYKNKKLEKLDKITNLQEQEKVAFDELSKINNDIIQELNEVKIGDNVENSKISSYIEQEKDLLQKEFKEIIEYDKTGSKLLKLLEITLEPEKNVNLSTLQQRKAVLMTDYILNNTQTDAEQALYICMKGKNDKQILMLKNLNNDSEDTRKVYIQLFYEKILLENYYRARSIVKDKYFVDDSSKQQLSQEINLAVGNILVNQVYNLLIKEKNTMYQELEIEAILSLLNQMQLDKLRQKVKQLQDVKQRKTILKRIG